MTRDKGDDKTTENNFDLSELSIEDTVWMLVLLILLKDDDETIKAIAKLKEKGEQDVQT